MSNLMHEQISVQSQRPEYPPSRIPLFPILSFGTFIPGKAEKICSMEEAGEVVPVTTGRMGLSLALEHMKIKAGEEVLIPAYHCNSMVEPVVNAEGKPVFYGVDANALVDLDDVERKITGKTRAILVTHYFGFPQDLEKIRSFCDRNELVLIEDCAHVFFGEVSGKPIGSFGDYTFSSPMKFFALYDGGYFVSNRHSISNTALSSKGLSFSASGLLTILSRSIRFKRLGILNPAFRLLGYLKKSLKKTEESVAVHPQDEPTASKDIPAASLYGFSGYFSGLPGEFDRSWIHVRMSWISRFLIRTSSKSRIIGKRRQNYKKLIDELSDLPGCRLLFPELQGSVVPYVLPLMVDDPERVFPRLKHLGVPISRFGEYLWEGMDKSGFPVAIELSRKVLQFPCHQELTEKELNWMIEEIKNALRV